MKLKKPKFWDSSRFSFWVILLFPISILFLLFSYIKKFQSSKNFPVPIICVGNIYLGGTGKTPLVAEIFKITKSLGKNPAFVKKHYDYSNEKAKIALSLLTKTQIEYIRKKHEKGGRR